MYITFFDTFLPVHGSWSQWNCGVFPCVIVCISVYISLSLCLLCFSSYEKFDHGDSRDFTVIEIFLLRTANFKKLSRPTTLWATLEGLTAPPNPQLLLGRFTSLRSESLHKIPLILYMHPSVVMTWLCANSRKYTEIWMVS